MARSDDSDTRDQSVTHVLGRGIRVVVEHVLRSLFTKSEKPTYFEVRSTYDASFVLRTLTPEARAWSEKFLAEPLPNGDRLVSSAIVTAIAAEAIARGYLVRFV